MKGQRYICKDPNIRSSGWYLALFTSLNVWSQMFSLDPRLRVTIKPEHLTSHFEAREWRQRPCLQTRVCFHFWPRSFHIKIRSQILLRTLQQCSVWAYGKLMSLHVYMISLYPVESLCLQEGTFLTTGAQSSHLSLRGGQATWDTSLTLRHMDKRTWKRR